MKSQMTLARLLRCSWMERVAGALVAITLITWNLDAWSAEGDAGNGAAETGEAQAATPGSATTESTTTENAEAETSETSESEDEVAEELTQGQMFEGGSETFNNWVVLSVGSMLTSGSKAEARERHRLADGPFGGIEDLHIQQDLGKNVILTLDGRALFDLEDYAAQLSLSRENLGFLRVRYEQFQTWYNGNSGYYRPADLWFPPADSTLSLDRGEFSVIAGLTLKSLPAITFEYVHRFRDGQKDSTSWGPVNLGFHSGLTGTRAIAPAFQDIDEATDVFRLDVAHRFGNTDVGLGARYETTEIDNARKMTLSTGEPVQRRVTNREESSNDTISAHGFTETWFKNKVFLSTGFLYSRFESDFGGSRIFGDDFDVAYAPNALNGAGYFDLDGVLDRSEYVMNVNLMATPFTNLTVVPSLRVQWEDWDAEATGLRTMGVAAPVAAAESAEGDSLDVRERLDARYTGFSNWVLFVRGEWTQGEGQLEENGAIGQAAGVDRETEDERWFQKYTAGARFYPRHNLTFDFGGYYKRNEYEYDHQVDNTANASGNRYPAYLVMQSFETFDQYIRLTLRPLSRVTVVGRYEHQFSTIETRPDPASGLSGADSSEMTSHIFAANIGWIPTSRLALHLGANYVISETDTPTSRFTGAVLDARNNYWTLNLSSTFVLDQKTDLNVGYFYYESNNYRDNSVDGLPLGAEGREHGVTALLTRRLRPNLRLNLRYAFFDYEDVLSGGNNNYQAHVLFSSLQYRF